MPQPQNPTLPSPVITLEWFNAEAPVTLDSAVGGQIRTLINDVVDTQAAIVWHHHPSDVELQQWLAPWPERIRRGTGNVALALVDGVVQGMGVWNLPREGGVGHVGSLTTIMTSPHARGMGLASRIVDALIAAATEAGAEILRLGVRGNNHAALSLYESRGFEIWGVIKDGVAVGNDRFDDVHMALTLPPKPGLNRIGSRPEGPGSSRRRS